MQDLFGKEIKPVLYIIGNGFDLHHGLPTRYDQFADYFFQTDGYYAGNVEKYYLLKNALEWNDLERALGDIDWKVVYEDVNDMEFDMDHSLRAAAQFEDAPYQMLEQTLDSLHTQFEAWVNSIDLSIAERDDHMYQFSLDGIYLTFNYTETLEAVYGIKREQINYIHGRRNSGDEIILGHDNEISDEEWFDESNTIIHDNAYGRIVEVANDQRKSSHGIIAANREFWTSLKGIGKVVVYGHSLTEVDLPYFETVKASIRPDSEWHFGCYNEKDRDNAREMASRLGIDDGKWCCFDF